MKVDVKKIFPVEFITLDFDADRVDPVLKEVYQKREDIWLSSISHMQTHTRDYFTDYHSPVKLDSFETIFEQIQLGLSALDIEVSLNAYWTALYKESAQHVAHIHRGGIDDSVNYSGILYLSDIGTTDFFSPHALSFNFMETINNKIGMVVLFPSNVVHSVSQHMRSEDTRAVVAFNMVLKRMRSNPMQNEQEIN